MQQSDLVYYSTDGIWTRFYPRTPDGEGAYNVMAEADPDGVVAFLAAQVPSVLAQLKAAGLTARKTKPPKPMTAAQLDALLAELEQ